jgi:hypothetical protein
MTRNRMWIAVQRRGRLPHIERLSRFGLAEDELEAAQIVFTLSQGSRPILSSCPTNSLEFIQATHCSGRIRAPLV